MSPVPLAELYRGELVESVHHGSLVAVDEAGKVLLDAGDTRTPMYPRSALKPLQALAMLRLGLGLDGELLALACASHAGEPFHLDGVRRILRDAGLAEADLQNTPGLPLNEQAARAYGTQPTCVAANCSGKHAAMLATCVSAGLPTFSYRENDHPVQQRIRETIAKLAGEPISSVAPDGCGAPAFALSLTALATAFAALPNSTDPHERSITSAMSTFPEWVDGTGRSNTVMMGALPGAIAKSGAEGVLALAIPGGPALAMKVADGSKRPLDTVAVAALRTLGIHDPRLDELAEVHAYGHGKPVGELRAIPLG